MPAQILMYKTLDFNLQANGDIMTCLVRILNVGMIAAEVGIQELA